VAWDIPGNSSSTEVREGETVSLKAPAEVDLGNGTRLVFKQWSTGDKSPTIFVGPGRYVAQYDVYFLVGWKATNYTYAQWTLRGAKINAPKVTKVYDDGQTRVFVAGWTTPDGQPVQFPYTVNAPVNFTAAERREHYARIIVWDRKEEGWYPHGYAAYSSEDIGPGVWTVKMHLYPRRRLGRATAWSRAPASHTPPPETTPTPCAQSRCYPRRSPPRGGWSCICCVYG
jgi:hypothetical protein